jgi:cell division protease FtsH
MKPPKTSFWSRYGRYVTRGVTVAAFAGLVTFLYWRPGQHNAQLSPAPGEVANQMRNDPSAWTHQEKDFSEMLRDIREQDVMAIGVSPNAILVSTRGGAKNFVTGHNAAFSKALLLGEIKTCVRPPYQIAWLPHANIRTGTARWIDASDKTHDAINILLSLLLIGGLIWLVPP